nr:hypothetical protein [Polymorphobacter sp.]
MIASVGPALPHDLFAASGRYAGPLGWSLDRPMPFAARWMETKFAPWAASILEDWAAGAFDAYEAVVFARADDNAQRLYYYLCELRRQGVLAGPEPLVFDSAQGSRTTSLDRTTAMVRKLAARLDIDDSALDGAIVATNAARAKRAELSRSPKTCLVAGTAPPDRGLHDAIEAQGWHAAGPVLADVWADAGPPVDAGTGDPCAAIGRQLWKSPLGNRAVHDGATKLAAAVAATSASAVVLWYSEDEEAGVWHLPAERKMLDDAGIATLVLTRRPWGRDDDGAAAIGEFLRGVTA